MVLKLEIAKIPMLSVRLELQNHLEMLKRPGFATELKRLNGQPVRTEYQDWFGLPEVLLTQVLQRGILGLEGYLPAAVRIGHERNGGDPEASYLINPFELPGVGTADKFYNQLPAKLDPAFSLSKHDGELWARTSALYREVRNPIFHGHQLVSIELAAVVDIFAHVCELYDWIDTWMPLHEVAPGAWQVSHRRVIPIPADG